MFSHDFLVEPESRSETTHLNLLRSLTILLAVYLFADSLLCVSVSVIYRIEGKVFYHLPSLDAFHHECSTALPRFSAFEWRYFIVVSPDFVETVLS